MESWKLANDLIMFFSLSSKISFHISGFDPLNLMNSFKPPPALSPGSVEDSLIESINACRIYHGVTWMSNMCSYDGKNFHENYLNGLKQQREENDDRWPYQPNPTRIQWDIWKRFIHSFKTMNTFRNQMSKSQSVQKYQMKMTSSGR